MRVIVIGGHGRTGLELVRQLVAANHEVVATIRNPGHMADIVRLGARAVMIDLEKSSLDHLTEAMAENDAVIFAAGSGESEQSSALDRTGTLRTVRAAEKAGVARFISVSALGASTGLSTRSMSDQMKDYYKQKRAAARHIANSKLDWTIVEPAELTEDKGSGTITASLEALDGKPIARANVAAAVIALLDNPAAKGKAIQLGGGDVPVARALAEALS
jgi:uncharacterized protein YbjT (DUF2867 family)